MVDRTAEDESAPDVLPGFETVEEPEHKSPHGRRALWISVTALVVAGAVAVPVVLKLTKQPPATLQTPAHLAGLSLDAGANAASTADYLRSAIAAGMNLDSSVGAVYSNGGGDAHSVIFVGGTTSNGSPAARLTTLFGLMDDGTDGIMNITPEPAGALGGQLQCGTATEKDPTGSAPATPMSVCGWADNTTVGISLFPNRSIEDAAALLRTMRTGIETKR
jgi:hypothetical protein